MNALLVGACHRGVIEYISARTAGRGPGQHTRGI